MGTGATREVSELATMPRVTVLMPVYNGERYLREAIDSILAQTFTDFEFIIVDDGSTDETPTILNGYTDPRIVRLRNQTNVGLVESLNRGLAAARGEYIARQDADDVSLPQRLEKQLDFLESHPDVGLVGTTFAIVNSCGVILGIPSVPTQNGDIQERLLCANNFCHGSVMFRRKCLEVVGAYRADLFPAEDYDLWLRIGEHFQVANLSDVLYQWRDWDASISGENTAWQQERILHAVEEALKRRMSTRLADDVVAQQTLARGHLFVAIGKWALREVDAGNAYLQQAIRLDEPLVHSEFLEHVLNRAWSIQELAGTEIDSAVRFVETAFCHLPTRLSALRKLKHRAVAKTYALMAFKAHQLRDKGTTRRCALLAIRHDPTWLLSRGILVMLARSWLGG